MENYIEEYNAYLMKIKKKHSELNQKLSAVDLEEQDILHFIEFEKCDAVTMMKLMKKLKDVRTRRREIKDEVDKVNAVNKDNNFFINNTILLFFNLPLLAKASPASKPG